MDYEQIERDLKFIRDTMESSTRYTIIPSMGYIYAGLLGLLGPGATWLIAGSGGLADPGSVTFWHKLVLGLVWSGIFFAAVIISAVLMTRHARERGTSAWSPPASRMFLSQAPQLIFGAVLTLALAYAGKMGLIPAWWLTCYGLTLFGFHYYTGRDHLVQAVCFLAMGAVAAFSPGWLALALLAAGFGGINLAFGARRILRGD